MAGTVRLELVVLGIGLSATPLYLMRKKIKIVFSILLLIILSVLFKTELRMFYTYINDFSKVKITQYDKITEIVISGAGCYGECEVFDISLKRNGDAIFRNGKYTKQKGLFKGKVDKSKIDTFLTIMRNANILNAEEYLSFCIDGYNYSLSLIENDMIIGTFYYCIDKEVLAYDSVFAYINQIRSNVHNIKNYSFSNKFLNNAYFAGFERDTLLLGISNSENFYLLQKIDQFEISNEKFITKNTQLFIDTWAQYSDQNNYLLFSLDFYLNAPIKVDSIKIMEKYNSELNKYPNYLKLAEYNFQYLRFTLNSNKEIVMRCGKSLESYFSRRFIH